MIVAMAAFRSCRRRHPRGDPVAERAGEPGERLVQQLAHPGEVVGHRTERHVGGLGHLPVRGAGHSDLRDDVEAGVDDPVAPSGIVPPNRLLDCLRGHAYDRTLSVRPYATRHRHTVGRPFRASGSIQVRFRAEDSPRGLWRSLGKRVGFTPSRVRISYPPPPAKTDNRPPWTVDRHRKGRGEHVVESVHVFGGDLTVGLQVGQVDDHGSRCRQHDDVLPTRPNAE